MNRNVGSAKYNVDGRKAECEKNDCTVRALAIAASIPYEIAWLALTLCGRRKGSGISKEDWIEAYQKNGLCLDSDIIADWKTNPIKLDLSKLDNIIVHCMRHIYAVKDGKHSDGNSVGSKSHNQERRLYSLENTEMRFTFESSFVHERRTITFDFVPPYFVEQELITLMLADGWELKSKERI